MSTPQALALVRAQLGAQRRPDEVISPLSPRLLLQGRWWPFSWPEALEAGIIEARRGYRFRPENLALAHVLREQPRGGRVCELGYGTGSLLLMAIAFLDPQHWAGLEVQPAQADRARRTFQAHGHDARALLEGDLRDPHSLERLDACLAGPADLVVLNPPFFPATWGRPSAHPEVRHSTHAHHGDLGDFLTAAKRLLAPTGQIALVYDAQRLAQLLAAAGDLDLCPQRWWWIPAKEEGPPEPFRIWVTLRHGQSITPLGARP